MLNVHYVLQLVINLELLNVVILIYSICSADVTITDLPDFVPLIKMNIEENKALIKGTTEAAPLTWGQDIVSNNFHYILLADCIYYEEVISLNNLVVKPLSLSLSLSLSLLKLL